MQNLGFPKFPRAVLYKSPGGGHRSLGMKSILRVFSYLRRYPVMALVQLFCAVGMTLAVFVFPNATGHVIDKVIPDPSRHH